MNLNKYIVQWVIFFIGVIPREYQKEFLNLLVSNIRVCARWCRQTGKTTTVGWYALFKATTIKNLSIIIIAPTQRQSSEFFNRIIQLVNDSTELSELVISQSKTEICFFNGSVIRALPCGHSGNTIRGITADIIIIEECGYMKDLIVNGVIIPMIASKALTGQIIKIGTPFGKNNFHESCFSPRYSQSYVNWEDAVKTGTYTKEFIDEMKESIPDQQFATEYDATFIDDADSYFKTDTINEAIEDFPMITEVYG